MPIDVGIFWCSVVLLTLTLCNGGVGGYDGTAGGGGGNGGTAGFSGSGDFMSFIAMVKASKFFEAKVTCKGEVRWKRTLGENV